MIHDLEWDSNIKLCIKDANKNLLDFKKSICMQDTFARATHSAARPSARDDRVSCIQEIY